MFPVTRPVFRLLALAAVVGLAVGPVTSRAGAGAVHSTTPLTRGADISWPNCPKGEGIPSRRTQGEPMPTGSATFVIVGLTNGPGFYPNPCLGDQVSWALDRQRLIGAYAMTTYPSRTQYRRNGSTGPYPTTTRISRLANAGYAEAAYNIVSLADVGLSVPMVWVDVEPYPVAPWSHHKAANRAVIRGVIRGYRHDGLRVGLYTYARGWAQVVGRWRLPKYPTWVPSGTSTAHGTSKACRTGASGGRTWIAQWSTRGRDHDLACPGTTSRRMRQMFTGS